MVLIKRDTFLAFTLVDTICRVLDEMWYGECDCCAEIIVWKEGNMTDCSFKVLDKIYIDLASCV